MFKPTVITSEGVNGIRSLGLGPLSSAWLRRRLNGSDLRWWCDCLSLAVGCGGGWEVEGFS